MMTHGTRQTYRCSFCHKTQEQVERLIAGPDHVYICDECVALCDEIISEERATRQGKTASMASSTATIEARPATAQANPSTTQATTTRRHLIDLDDWTPDDFRTLLDRTAFMREAIEQPGQRLVTLRDTLRGQVMVNLFYENSTRTRTSFELAGKRLGADVTNIAASSSSVTKGESLHDTVATLQGLGANIFVVRSGQSGAPDLIARYIQGSVINAGDGWRGHPTQALLDLFTIERHLGSVAGKRVVILGDILHSRVARSNLWSLTAMGAEVTLCAPPTLLPTGFAAAYAGRNIPGSGATRKVSVEPNISRALADADVVMALRLQRERQQAGLLPSLREYTLRFGLSPERLALARPGALVMHPGPMNEGVEIDPAVAHGAASVIEEQVANGVATRMAVLESLALAGQGATTHDA